MSVSVLFGPGVPDDPKPREPESFSDLGFDQVVESITSELDHYELAPFFYTPLKTVDAIKYRHAVLRDLARPDVLAVVRDFTAAMRKCRADIDEAKARHYVLQRQAWQLAGIRRYCNAVHRLCRSLGDLDTGSDGLSSLHAYLTHYRASEEFEALDIGARNLLEQLADVKYSVLIDGNRVRVGPYEGERDYGADVQETFNKFRQGDAPSHLAKFSDYADMNHVEAQILGLVAKLNPETFTTLESYCREHREFTDPVVGRFDREVHFYVGYLDYIRPIEAGGLRFCLPTVSAHATTIHATDTFDVALAHQQAGNGPIVTNSFTLTPPERIIVVSGPNQGGKTTFARTFGQLHHLACLGLPVPGTDAELALFDHVFTHFEREEELANLHGNLEDELVRIHDVLAETGPDSIVILNEIFTSTTLADAQSLGSKILSRLIDAGALCVYVTFVDELSRIGPATVSMVSQVDPTDPARRTYKVERRRADGLAYAAAIAEKYGLSYKRLRERISP
ncbi:MutS-related protein [Spelaeicoccus albus]|uniref:DNA mismatch repair proteins mutS family domain-containing protein n=1 Tax=Spelaeicoccus albus TaxID=1280376 RepID=A0A7Z0IIU5_9MICO|nr:DNA mismatch repair protein MutS [Spelaeicoccus albus]NYI68868.1 hypothetical protein [Spelaeicoccus albus]